MKYIWAYFSNLLIITIFFVFGAFMTSCSRKTVVSLDQIQRMNLYIHSENEYIADMFIDEVVSNDGVQPALTRKELAILDALADRTDPEVRKVFDQKYTAWLNCWTPFNSEQLFEDSERQLLNCNGKEFQELIEFCRQQNDEIFLLLYQLAARATCPYDRLLLHPAYDLLENFPEFSKYWREVDLSLQNEKPDETNRICNESTIWQTRKMLETKYGFTYTNGLTSFFGTRKMLLTMN